jgi:hypothetical protein
MKTLDRSVGRARVELQHLTAALAVGRDLVTIVDAVREKERRVRDLESKLTALKRPPQQRIEAAVCSYTHPRVAPDWERAGLVERHAGDHRRRAHLQPDLN